MRCFLLKARYLQPIRVQYLWNKYSGSLRHGLWPVKTLGHTDIASHSVPFPFQKIFLSKRQLVFFAQQARLSMWSFEQSCTAGNVLQKLHDKIAKRITSWFLLSLGLFHLIMGQRWCLLQRRENFFIKTSYVLNFFQSWMGFFQSALPTGLWHDMCFLVTKEQ